MVNKAPKCKIGFPCGKSCISRTKNCYANLSTKDNKIAETFSQFVNRLVGIGNNTQSELNNIIESPNRLSNLKDKVKNFSSKYTESFLDINNSPEDIKAIVKEAYQEIVIPIKEAIKEKYGVDRDLAEKTAKDIYYNDLSDTFDYQGNPDDIINMFADAIEIAGVGNLDQFSLYIMDKGTYYSNEDQIIQLGLLEGDLRTNIFHEVAHDIEWRIGKEELNNRLNKSGQPIEVIKDYKYNYERLRPEDHEFIRGYGSRVYRDNNNEIVATEILSTFFELIANEENFSINSIRNQSGEMKKQIELALFILFGDDWTNG